MRWLRTKTRRRSYMRRVDELKRRMCFYLVEFCCGISQRMRLKEVELVKRKASDLDEDGAGSYAPKLTKLSLDLVGIWAKS